MFRFFHNYHPSTWDAINRLGWIGVDSGLRCMHHVFLPESEKFNSIMKKASRLRAILDEYPLPVYIDRLQGGIFFDEKYRFDKKILQNVKEDLGERFWGFQIHEWSSNLLNDWLRLEKAGIKKWTAKGIREALMRYYGTRFPWLEARSSYEFASLKKPWDAESFLNASNGLYSERAAAIGGKYLLPCDSFFMAPRIEIRSGAKRLMPEVGWQIKDMRIQMAYTRGMARAAGIPFGIYYEPWGGDPFGVCCGKDGRNEWNLESNGSWVFEMLGENGGSSRALQKRILRYAYLSGSSFASEEWGLANTFLDWNDFELSPYGKVKDDFIRYVRSHPDIGEPVTPIAVALPGEMDIFDLWMYEGERYLGFPLPDGEKKHAHRIREALRFLFGDGNGDLGNEAHVIRNGGMPDAFDILHSDQSEALKRYRYIIDLSGDGMFAKKYRNIISLDDVETVLKKELPCWVSGGVHWMVNQTADGYRVTIFNNNGIERSLKFGDYLLPDSEIPVTVNGVTGFRTEDRGFPLRFEKDRLTGIIPGNSLISFTV